MKELNFSTGLVTYSVNGGHEITFNPTDPEFIGKLFDLFNGLDERQAKYQAEMNATHDNGEAFQLARRMDTEMRGLLDGVFGEGFCQGVFEYLNVYAVADGLPVWANLLLAVMDECEAGFVAEQKATNPRLAKYTSKYSKK